MIELDGDDDDDDEDKQFDKPFADAARRRKPARTHVPTERFLGSFNERDAADDMQHDDDDVQVVSQSKKPKTTATATATTAVVDDDDDDGWTVKASAAPTVAASARSAKGRAKASKPPPPPPPADASAEQSSQDVPIKALARKAVVAVTARRSKSPAAKVTTPPPAPTTAANSATRGAKSKANVVLLDGTREDDDDDDFASIERAASPDDSFDGAKSKSPSAKLSKEEREARKRAAEEHKRAAEELKRAAKETKDRAKALKKAQPELLTKRVADDADDDDLEGLSDLMTKIADKPAAARPPQPAAPPLQADVAAVTSQRTDIWRLAEGNGATTTAAAKPAAGSSSGGKKAPNKRPAPSKAAAPVVAPKFIESSPESPPPASAPLDAENSDPLDLTSDKKKPASGPPFREGHNGSVDVDLIWRTDGDKIFGSTDRVLSGELESERMTTFALGGKQRSKLEGTVSTGYFDGDALKLMVKLLQERYKTEENIKRFHGDSNVLKLVQWVLLPELALTLLTVACGSAITRAQALHFLENPPNDTEKMFAAARGNKSKVAKSAQ